MDQSRLGKRIEHFEGPGFDLGIQACRALFPKKSLTGKAYSILVGMGNDLHRSGSSVEILHSGSSVVIDSLVETGSPSGSVVVIVDNA